MPRPPLWLWVCVISLGCGVLYADIRSERERVELDALKQRVASAERACFLTRSPKVVAEAKR